MQRSRARISNELFAVALATVLVSLLSVFMDYTFPSAEVLVVNAQLYESGYAIIHVRNVGYAPDRLKAVTIESGGKVYAGRVVAVSGPLDNDRALDSVIVPARSDVWIIVKFNTIPTDAKVLVSLALERSGMLLVEATLIPLNLAPAG